MCSRGLVRDRIVVLRSIGLLSSQLAELRSLRGRVEQAEDRKGRKTSKICRYLCDARRLQR